MQKSLALIIVSLIVVVSLFSVSTAIADPGKPPNQPHKGLIYDGLELPKDGSCKGAFKLASNSKNPHCSHGPDMPLDGLSVARDVAPVSVPAPAGAIPCDGDGSSGKRVQIIYAYADTDRYDLYLPSFRTWAAEADGIYNDSAAETGGTRHIRFVHDGACQPSVLKVKLTADGMANLANMVSELITAGFSGPNRKYMVFADARVYCGIADIAYDDQPGPLNTSNVALSFARIDSGCWSGAVAAHELMHNLGGVQLSAPHSSGGWHCTDGYDRMCYSDAPNYPTLQVLCQDTQHSRLLDCGHDDYYHTNPQAGSYLATHWNVANSQFLIGAPPPKYLRAYAVTAGEYRGRTFSASDSFRRHANVTVRVQVGDQDRHNVEGVAIDVQLWAPDGSVRYSAAGVSNAQGMAEVSFTLSGKDPSGVWNVHVSGISRPEYLTDFPGSTLDRHITHQ